MESNWITAELYEAAPGDEPDAPLYAIMQEDGPSLLLGEMSDVVALRDKLNALIVTAKADQHIDNLDESLGWRWLTTTEAAEEFDVPVSTVRRWMSDEIPGAEKRHGTWRAPAARIRACVVRYRQSYGD